MRFWITRYKAHKYQPLGFEIDNRMLKKGYIDSKVDGASYDSLLIPRLLAASTNPDLAVPSAVRRHSRRPTMAHRVAREPFPPPGYREP